MGKKHDSEENRGRWDRGNDKPNRDGGFRKPAGERDNRRPGGDNARGGYPSRPAFGRSNEGFGGNKRFGSNETGSRGYGTKPGGGYSKSNPDARRGSDDRRPFNRDRNEGGFDRRSAGRDNEQGGRFGRDSRRDDSAVNNRPVRPYEPKGTWTGQPYRQEGKATVPRGEKGERNRKFNKVDPFAAQRDTASQPAPQPQPRREGDTGPDREIRFARPFDYQGPPAAFRKDDAAESRPGRRERSEGFTPRSSGERSLGNRSFGNERRDGGFSKPSAPGRSFGDKRESFRAPREEGRPESRQRDPRQAGRAKRGEVAGQAPEYKNLRHYEEDKTRGNKRRRTEEESDNGTVRLNRYIANAGICSRRDADALIAAGEIRVNGEVVTEMGYQVQDSDTVQYGKTNLKREKLVYVLLNKPKDFITTTDDPEGRRTVMDLVAGASAERLFPVGRLDRNTTGLLLFTNDGEVAQKLTHPSHKNKKIYQVELDKPLTEEHLKQIADGLELEDGKAEVDDVAVVAGNSHFVGVELHIGRNRIVRRIFEHLGYEVVTLDRVQYAGLTKKDLPRGKWRFLNEKEVIRLRYFL